MQQWLVIALVWIGFAGWPFAHQAAGQAGWVVLFDGKSLDNWTQIGDANWKLSDGIVSADKGSVSCLEELLWRFRAPRRVLG
jgi:hypothetical protein